MADVRYVALEGRVIGRPSTVARLRTGISDAFRRYSRRNDFWKSVPASSLVLFYSGLFCLFAVVGIIAVMTDLRLPTWGQVAGFVLYCGGTAVLLAMAAIRKRYVFIPLILVANITASIWLNRMLNHRPRTIEAHSPLQTRFVLLGQAGVVALAAGYAFFMFFFGREGTRYFRAHTEIELAHELHQALVPTIQRRIGDFEIFGASIPSGEVGGDLVDLVQLGDDDWTAYVADVSGHGVSPGVLMAMFKATVRARMQSGCDGANLLQAVHETLHPLKTSNMFVTAGFLQAYKDRLRLSLAGHPALLHFRRESGQVCEYSPEDLPLGILPEQSFSARDIQCNAGDILLLLTDGITEASNKDGEELGVNAVKAGLCRWADLPLPELFRSIRELSLRFGKQQDDQTM